MEEYIWPEIFTTGNIKEREDAALCADALCAWGLCECGAEIPENFGNVMVDIATKLGVSASPDSLIKWATGKGYLKSNRK